MLDQRHCGTGRGRRNKAGGAFEDFCWAQTQHVAWNSVTFFLAIRPPNYFKHPESDFFILQGGRNGYRSLATVLSHQEALGEMRQLGGILEGALTYLLTSRTLVSMFNMKATRIFLGSLSCSYCSGTVSQASYSWTEYETKPYQILREPTFPDVSSAAWFFSCIQGF